jgi:hypothetical protein
MLKSNRYYSIGSYASDGILSKQKFFEKRIFTMKRKFDYLHCPIKGNDLFVTADYLGFTKIWSFINREEIVAFDTRIDAGGDRMALAMTPTPLLITGAYDVHGVSGYDALTGEPLWQRKDLKGIQYLRWIPGNGDTPLVGAGFDTKPFLILNGLTGEVIRSLRGYRRLYPSGYSHFVLGITSSEGRLISMTDWSVQWKYRLQSHAVLDATVSNNYVIFSEAGANLRCFNMKGDHQWELKPPSGSHFIRIGWNATSNCWLAIKHSSEKRVPKELYIVDIKGKINSKKNIGDFEECEFFSGGNYLITSSGKIIDTLDGNIHWELI